MVWEADWFVKLQKTNIIVEIATHGVLWVNQDLKVTFELILASEEIWEKDENIFDHLLNCSAKTCNFLVVHPIVISKKCLELVWHFPVAKVEVTF